MNIQPIGFQFPQAQQVDVLPVQVDTPASTTALDITNQGYAQLNRSAEQYQQTTQRTTQSTQQTADLLQQNSQRIAQAQSAVLQQQSASSNDFSQSLQGLQQGIGTLLSYDAKLKEIDYQKRQEAEKLAAQQLAALEKQQHDERRAVAVDDLERIQADWIKGGKIRDLGSDAYLDVVTKRVAEAALNGDDTVGLTQRYAQPAQEYSKEVYSTMQDAAKEVILKQREINKLTLVAPLSAYVAKIATSEGQSPTVIKEVWEKLNDGMASIMKNEQFPVIDRMVAVATALEQGLAGMSKSNENYERMAKAATAYRALTAYASEQRRKVNASEIPIQEYDDSVRIKALELGVSGYQPPDANAEGKFLQERLANEASITELRQKKALSEIDLIEADRAVISGLALDAVLDPAQAGAAIRKAAKAGADVDVNAVQALKIADDFIKFRDTEKPAYDIKYAGRQRELQQLQNNFNAWFVSNTKQAAPPSANPAMAKQLEILRGAGITPEALQGGRISQEQINLMQQSSEAIAQSIINEQAVDTRNYENRLLEFGQYGLSLDTGIMKNNRAAVKVKIDGYNKLKADIQLKTTDVSPVQGLTGTFKRGPVKQLTTRSYAGKSMVVPFAPNVANNIPDASGGRRYGAPRPGRSHTGLDFAVATGTEVLSLVEGTVLSVENHTGADSYGLNVEVLAPDGMVYHYAHLSGTSVVAGQPVQQGEVIALSGDSGTPGSQHLHFGTYSKDRTQVYNPEEILARNASGGGPKPRTAGFAQPTIPRGAIPLGKDSFLLGGKMYRTNDPSRPMVVTPGGQPRGKLKPASVSTSTAASPLRQLTGGGVAPPSAGGGEYPSGMPGPSQQTSRGKLVRQGAPVTPGMRPSAGVKTPPLQQQQQAPRPVKVSNAQPVRNSYASNVAADYPRNIQPDHHHGYTILANDKPLAREINRVANRFGMPGQWLADVIAYESAGTFSPRIDNGMGFSGLIQFGDAILQDLGISRQQLNSETAAGQMKYVEQYLALRLRQSGVKAYKGPEWLVAGINQGNVGIQQVDKHGAAAIADPRNSDGYTTLLKYMQTLGKYSGRQYNFLGNRAKRTSAVIHDRPKPSCSLCSAIGDNFIRHQAPSA